MSGLTSKEWPKTWRISCMAPRDRLGARSSAPSKSCAWMFAKSSANSSSRSPWSVRQRPMGNKRDRTIASARVASAPWIGKTARPKSGSCKPRSARPNGRNRKGIAAAVGGLFFPQSRSLGIDQRQVSPAVLEKITYAGTASRSYAQARQLLEKLAGLLVDDKQVERL